MTSKVYVGDVGTQIILDCVQDITEGTELAIRVRRPDGTTTTWSAVSAGPTKLKYTTVANDLSMPGVWVLQADVTTVAGRWLGETAQLRVYSPFA